jgi:hypothetical protein
VEAPLDANSEFTIGYYEWDGYDNFTFTVNAGEEVDIGFFKIFVSVEPLDLTSLLQSSPFHRQRSTRILGPTMEPQWDAVTIPVITYAQSIPA